MDIEEQYDKLYRYCFFRVKNETVAEDIVQEAFLRFFESEGYLDKGRTLAYLYTIARNLCMDEFRRERHFSSEEREASSDGFEQESVERLALWSVMEELSEEERELLLLRYVNELPMRTLETLYGRSRFALRRELKKLTERLKRRITDGTKN